MTDVGIHLALRSDMSIGESMLQLDKIPALLKERGYTTAALMDTMTVSGMVPFSRGCKKEEIKPIIGCRVRVVDDPRLRDKNAHKRVKPVFPKLYVRNPKGLEHLFLLLSVGWSEEFFYYAARLGWEELHAALRGGGLAVSSGDFSSVFMRNDYEERMLELGDACGRAQTFLELLPIHTPYFDTINERIIEFHRAYPEFPLIVSRPALYANDDADTLDVLEAIAINGKMGQPWIPLKYMRDLRLLTRAELLRQVKISIDSIESRRGKGWCSGVWREALEGMSKLADLTEFEWEKRDVSLPKMADDETATLIQGIQKGWAQRIGQEQLGYKPAPELIPQYKERLAYELQTLRKMGFERYFLLVQDLVSWSKANGIIVGPGRGSVGGSLIAYLLGITDVDPLRFNLIFERFINPDRIDLPDADLDFMSSRRQEVIEYLRERYGNDRVVGIANYNTMASAGALRDVARTFSMNPRDYACSKLVPSIHGKVHSLEQAAEEVPEIDGFSTMYPDIWKHACKLQGNMRALGKHAGGVIVAGEPVVKRGALDARDKNALVVTWDKRVVEDQGLVKMDILGLSTLDVLAIARDKIRERHGVDVDLLKLPLDDAKVLQAFGEGDTVGVFQFESGGMRGLLKDLASREPLTFDDVVAATALYRPGPMDSGLLDDYVGVKKGQRSISYDHPNMEDALRATYGVIIYQEQVMQVARDLAGYTMAEADKLRKIMGKKLPEEMAKQRGKWVDGCKAKSGMDERASGILFDKIEKFAGYGFNKSHAVEYSIISYWALWLKIHYPAEFFAASLTIMGEDKLKGLVQNAAEHGIALLPPDVNHSTQTFEVIFDDRTGRQVLLAPFSRVLGLSDKTAQEIMRAREQVGGKFTSFLDFFSSIQRAKCNKRAQIALDKVGAFSSLLFDDSTLAKQKQYPDIQMKQLPPAHPDRLRDQIALLPGLIAEHVQVGRTVRADKFVQANLKEIIREVVHCEGCDLHQKVHPLPHLGRSPHIMIITDHPNFGEDKEGQMGKGDASAYLRTALKAAKLTQHKCYITSLVKAPREGKQLENAQINACAPFLRREIEALKPTVIVALGGQIIRHLGKDVKGGFMELCGQVHFNAEFDANIVYGLNPQIIYMRPEHQEDLNRVLKIAADLM